MKYIANTAEIIFRTDKELIFSWVYGTTTLTVNFKKPHYPSKIANTLASLVKGEVLSPEKIRATTGGIVTPPTFPTPHYPPRFS